jgi:hypothetical protein
LLSSRGGLLEGHRSPPVRRKQMLSPPAFSSALKNEDLPDRAAAGVYFP